MHVARVLRDLEREGIPLVGPTHELVFPGMLLGGDPGETLHPVRVSGERARLEPVNERSGSGPRIAMDPHRDRFDEPKHAGIGVDLDDLGAFRPVIESMLRQRSKRTQARAEREHHVRLRNELHRRLRALIAERSGPQAVRSGERVIVQVTAANRRVRGAQRALPRLLCPRS